jgi:hypothetical protein
MSYNEQSLNANFTLYDGDKPVRAAVITKVFSDSLACTGEDHAPYHFTFATASQIGWYIVCPPDSTSKVVSPDAFAEMIAVPAAPPAVAPAAEPAIIAGA